MKHDPNTPRCFPGWLQKLWPTLEWRDDPTVIAEREREQRVLKNRAQFEVRRKQLLVKAEKALLEIKAEIAWMEVEEKREAAIERDRAESQRVFTEYVAALRTQMQTELRKQAEIELAPLRAKVKEFGKQIHVDRVQQERKMLLRRGVVKGRRR